MELGDGHIIVWVGQEEKLICGLTKNTTSADVVQALLEEQQNVMSNSHVQLGNPTEYYIIEIWRGFQYTLPPSTKMLKLREAWGAEQVNVSFLLAKSDLVQSCLMWNSDEYDKHTNYPHYSTASVIKSYPLQKQKNIVRKAFRKLAMMKKDMDLQEKDSIQKLVQVIASQDLTIKKQINRMQELDEQIEIHKTYLHLDKDDADEHSAQCSHLKKDELKQQRCKVLLDTDSLGECLYINEKTNNPHMHFKKLSNNMNEEIPPRPIYQCEDLCADEENLNENCEMRMLLNFRQGVNESLHVGVILHSLFNSIQKEIHHHDSVLLRQKSEYDALKQELKLLNESNDVETYRSLQPYKKSISTESSEELSNITLALSVISMQSDTDSDTGISSTHSQNSDPVPWQSKQLSA